MNSLGDQFQGHHLTSGAEAFPLKGMYSSNFWASSGAFPSFNRKPTQSRSRKHQISWYTYAYDRSVYRALIFSYII